MKRDRPTVTIFFICCFFVMIFGLLNHITPDDVFGAGALLGIYAAAISFFVALCSAWRAENPVPADHVEDGDADEY